MRLTAILSLSIFMFNIQGALAGGAWPSTYLSGRDVCDQSVEVRSGEIGHFVSVPLDYNDISSSEKTQIFYWTLTPFQAELPTLIYFVGGPGGSAHGFSLNQLQGWNVVYMDQRGTACSRFASEAISMSAKYYSSEFIARDAEAIRQDLGIQNWSVYGHSYGTIPATIYAHLFPSSTNALALEGVVDRGDSSLWNAPHRLKILQHIFNHLPEDLKNVIRQMSLVQGSESLFSQVTFTFMYTDESEKKIINYLNDIKSQFDESTPFSDLSAGFNTKAKAKELLGGSDNSYSAITCRELSAQAADANFYYEFKNDRFQINSDPELQKERIENCKSFGVENPSGLIQMYESKNYPISVPVTYFQGTTDGATEPNHAVKHYKQTAQGPKQLLLKKQGGHTASQSLIAASAQDIEDLGINKSLPGIQAEIFSTALQGKKIPVTLLKSFNDISPADWVATSQKMETDSPQSSGKSVIK